MEKGLSYGSKAVKKFGFRGILDIISLASWFLLPFVIWLQIYNHIGQGYFILILAAPALVLIIPCFVYFIIQFGRILNLDRKLMRHVEHAKEVFDDPADSNTEQNFRQECNKFILPYLYYPKMVIFGISNLMPTKLNIRGRVIVRLLSAIIVVYTSYAMFVFIITNQSYFNHIWTFLAPVVPYSHEITFAGRTFLQNPMVAISLLFLLSLYSHSAISYVRKGIVTYSAIFWDVVLDVFSIFLRLLNAIVLLSIVPFLLKRKGYSLKYEPFTFPTKLPLVIQKSVWNIERVICNVTEWSRVVSNEKDIEELKMMIAERKEIPSLIRFLALKANPRKILNLVGERNPTLYLGTIDKRCSVLARVEYDQDERMFRAMLVFDNQHVRDEFKSIAEIEIGEQKKIKEQLPTSLKGAMRQLGVEEL